MSAETVVMDGKYFVKLGERVKRLELMVDLLASAIIADNHPLSENAIVVAAKAIKDMQHRQT